MKFIKWDYLVQAIFLLVVTVFLFFTLACIKDSATLWIKISVGVFCFLNFCLSVANAMVFTSSVTEWHKEKCAQEERIVELYTQCVHILMGNRQRKDKHD